MYWCKKCLIAFIGLILILCFASCKRDSSASVDTSKFFDLKGYFAAEAARLKKLNPNVDKIATYNYETEEQKVHISNWASELSMFSESDINKPAWRLSYDVESSNGFISYKAKDTTLKTQDIVIKRDGNKIKWIIIGNHTKSTIFGKKLYEAWETLSYIPDSAYHIKKKQYTRFLGVKVYNIKGKFD